MPQGEHEQFGASHLCDEFAKDVAGFFASGHLSHFRSRRKNIFRTDEFIGFCRAALLAPLAADLITFRRDPYATSVLRSAPAELHGRGTSDSMACLLRLHDN